MLPWGLGGKPGGRPAGCCLQREPRPGPRRLPLPSRCKQKPRPPPGGPRRCPVRALGHPGLPFPPAAVPAAFVGDQAAERWRASENTSPPAVRARLATAPPAPLPGRVVCTMAGGALQESCGRRRLLPPGMEWGACLLTQPMQKVSPAPQFPRTALSILFISFLITIWLNSGNQDRGGDYDYPLRGSADFGWDFARGEGDVLGAMIGSLGLIL